MIRSIVFLFNMEPVMSDDEEIDPRMDRWDETKPQDEQKFLGDIKIIVETEEAREQILLALRYLHDRDIDTMYMGVNALVHMYNELECIIVKGTENERKA